MQMTAIKTLAAASLVALVASLSSAEETRCAARQGLDETMMKVHGESVRVRAINADENVMIELWSNQDNGSWTITATGTDGVACLLADGMAHEILSAARQGEGS